MAQAAKIKERIIFENQEEIKLLADSPTDIEKERKKALHTRAEEAVKINKSQLAQTLKENQIPCSEEDLNNFNFEQGKQMLSDFKNETTFAVTSIFEGFLSVYGVEMDKALENYENQLAILEQTDSSGNRAINIGRIFRNGKAKILHTGCQSLEQAKQAIQLFRKHQNQEAEFITQKLQSSPIPEQTPEITQKPTQEKE